MNRYRMRFAPRVWTPKLHPTAVRWLRPLRLRRQAADERITYVKVIGQQIVRQQLDAGNGVMIMPNHSSHADPYVIYSAADQIPTALHIMATWHVFHDKPWLVQHALRIHGCFSVDREANDIKAFRLACDILQTKSQPLVIFPEGEIYHCNERVTPFREGAAAIAVASARKAKRKIVCIPCSMTYRYEEDPTDSLVQIMGELESAILWRRREDRPLTERIYAFAEVLLNVKELEYYGETRVGALPDRITSLGDHILSAVESRHEITPGGAALPERVKAARRTIIAKLSDGDENSSEESSDRITAAQRESLHRDLEDLFLVVQSFSYPGDYVSAKPSIERMAETMDKFEEDVLQRSTASIKAARSAVVQFGDPVEVIGDRKVRGQATDITSQIESSVQAMLDQQTHDTPPRPSHSDRVP